MFLGSEFVMVDEPGQVILHDKEQGINFRAGAAFLTQAVIYVKHQQILSFQFEIAS